ncbi:transient receptor potential channel pyrexia isoform X1 [Condylostylus longicornis]|uniref:transient receptor potential channel pyrexia isoform X1 n=1 Tax=Condylostylus longicornis TaxID=2530218 RepID=UPI00244E04BD|nr:transient receptor potential channel pyrexia isoform X1 [Condylostylus longicornis]
MNMENIGFSLHGGWHDSADLYDKGSISSEDSSEGVCNEEFHQFFHRHQRSHIIWDPKEIEFNLKESPNGSEILRILTIGCLDDLKPGSIEVNLALLFSCWYKCTDNAISLLENFSPNPNCTDSRGRTPLHFACSNGDAIIAKTLLDHGAEPNCWDKQNKGTPLHCAASAGSVECILLLLKRKASINVGIEKRTALHFAIDKNAVDCVETLLKYGADPNTPQVFTETPLHTACALGHTECARLLLNYGADVRSRYGKRKLTALHLAAEDDYVDCVKILLDKGAQVDARNADDQTPLHLACLSQCVETVEILIKFGADVNAVYKDGRTALHAAIVKQTRCLECVNKLIQAGAEVNKSDNYGYTPLHIAALNEFSNCVQLLIDNGGDITSRTNGGITALSFIVRRTPDIIPKFIAKLDSSIKVNDHEIGDVDCEIKLDFRQLVPNTERGESELIMSFIEVGQKRILTHPLCETFLFLKWRRIRKFFLMSLFYHAAYVLLFSLYVTGVYVKSCLDDASCRPSSYSSVVGYFVVVLNLALTGREFFEMGHGIYAYAKYWENWLQWTIILGVFLCVTPDTIIARDLEKVPKWQFHIAAIIIFLVWLELMMLVGRFPIFGLYIQMFTKVAVNFGKFLLAYCCLLIAFALSFSVLFSRYKAFKSIPWSFLKVVTMMAGELEFEDIFYGEEEDTKSGDASSDLLQADTEIISFPVTSHIIFLAFVLLVTVILTNLVVGLAVSDIQGLQVSAGLDRLIRQAELVSRLEGLFFSRLLRKTPPKLLSLCQRSALLRTSRYQLQFMTRPNDPRDTQLPEDIKLNIFKLVADRRDRNQTIRRRRCEDNFDTFQRSVGRYDYSMGINCSKEDTCALRPRSIAFSRQRLFSDNEKGMNKIKLTAKNSIFDSTESDELKDIKTQLRDMKAKFDKFTEILSKKMNVTAEELCRIKMQLDQRSQH